MIGGRRISKSLNDFGINAEFIPTQDFLEMGCLKLACDTLLFAASPTLKKYKADWLIGPESFENITCNKLVFLSSAAVYGLSSQIKPFSEIDIPSPITDYGFEKLEYENQLARIARTKKWNFLNLRISGIYNDINQSHDFTSLINKVRNIKISKETLLIECSGTQFRDFCRLSTLFRFIEMQSVEPNLLSGTINFKTTKPTDLKSILSDLDMKTRSYIKYEDNVAESIHCTLNNTKLQKVYPQRLDEDARTYFE